MTMRDAQAFKLTFVPCLGMTLVCLALAACSTSPQTKTQPSIVATPSDSVSSASTASRTSMPPATSPAPAAAPQDSPQSPNPPSAPMQAQSAPPAAGIDTAKPPVKDRSPVGTGTNKTETSSAKKHPEVAAPQTKQAGMANEKAKPVASAPVVGSSLAGHIDLVAGADQPLAADEMMETAIYFVPNAGAPHPKPGRFNIYTREKRFDPSTLVIPVGSTVSFPNKDQILHNVFSITTGATFDLGLYGEGGSADYTFKTPGLALINCNVHQAMQANVLVLDTPYFTHPDKDGKFRLNVPAGPGKLMLWHPRAAIQSSAIAGPMTDPLALRLVLTKPRVVQHLNKERKVY